MRSAEITEKTADAEASGSRDPQPVRTFQAFTPELPELARWLKRCGIETVALESTGIYWISLYEVLEQYGFDRERID